MNVFKTSFLATTLIAGSALSPAHAVDADSFLVQIDIIASCDVTSTAPVMFADRVATAGTIDSTGGVTVQCTRDQAYHVKLNSGANGGGDITARKMLHSNGIDTIAYQLRQDSATGPDWGDVIGTADTGTGTGFGTGAPFDQNHVVYATATLVGTEPVGAYSDTITATVSF